MADRPSVNDILAKARAAKAGEAAPESSAPAASAGQPAKPAPVAAPAPTGRPLSLKEKLAAAKATTATAPAAAPAAAAAQATPAAQAASAPAVKVPTPAELGRPLTLKEKLAAAKATGGAAPSAAAAAPAQAATAAKLAAARELPPLAEMNDPRDLAEALRQTAAKPAAGGKPAAAKPAAAKKEALDLPPRPNKIAAMASLQGTRRRFMIGTIPATAWLIIAWTTFTTALVAFSAMLGRFFFPNVLAEPPSTIKVGPTTQFEPGEVNERWKAEWGFWIVRSVYNGQDMLYALSTICTHLGCPPNWLAGEQKFKCPCHGSGFYVSGINFECPAPRPLERFKVSVGDDGQIVVDKSAKYQEELGQWNDPDSFIPV
ncbi:MAG: ubiquinol-cytochrome c reductase iron-sulfur subunit [Planctomycetota bacterium]